MNNFVSFKIRLVWVNGKENVGKLDESRNSAIRSEMCDPLWMISQF